MNEGLTCRRACQLMGLSRSSLAYVPRPDRSEDLRSALKAVWCPNMGYRMGWARVRRKFIDFSAVNVKKVHRLWRELALSVQPKRTRKLKTGQEVYPKAAGPGDVWCLDFLQESALNGENIRILAVKDEFTRQCISLEAASSFKAVDVARLLKAAFELFGKPKHLRSDNGPEFIANSLSAFLETESTEALRIKPGSPWQNGFIESFNSRLRTELLDVQVFYNLSDAQLHLSAYRQDYNEERPHSSLNYKTPNEFAAAHRKWLENTISAPIDITTQLSVGT